MDSRQCVRHPGVPAVPVDPVPVMPPVPGVPAVPGGAVHVMPRLSGAKWEAVAPAAISPS